MNNTLTKTYELKELLEQRGFPKAKAIVWAEFVHQVLRIYWLAADQLIEPTNWTKFKQKLGAMGKPKRRGKGRTVQIPVEDAITAELGHLAENIRKQLPSDHFLRKHDVYFGFEDLIFSKQRTGRHSKKVDFRIFSQFLNAPELAIEAKPLSSSADIESKYLSEGGIGCFFMEDSSYTKGPLGAMFAYSINEAGISMRNDILNALHKYTPKPAHIDSISTENRVVIDCSHHERDFCKLPEITILHLERNFPPDVSHFCKN